MRFDTQTNTLTTEVSEFVSLARRGTAAVIPLDESEPSLTPDDRYVRRRFLQTDEPKIPLILQTTLSDGEQTYPLSIRAFADKIEGEKLHFLCLTDTSPDHPKKEWTAQVRAEGYVGAYAFAQAHGLCMVSVTFHYVNPATERSLEIEEHLPLSRLQTFFRKCLGAVARYARPAVHRATVRLPSMAKATFPYGQMRAGQDELVESVYHTLKRGGSLLAEAPTGIGKTVSVLYPAIRAMGDGACEKVFYLTPKTTTATAALSCLCDLASTGVDLRAVSLTAKEKICPMKTVCRQSKTLCPYLKNNKLAEGALALFDLGLPSVTEREIRAVAKEQGLCPYELSLTYSELCDVVVGDINYLFDRRVYLRRFFETGGDFAFLVDEAHNLPDRAREMYSDELSEHELSFPEGELGEHNSLRAAIDYAHHAWRELLFPLVRSDLRRDAQGQTVGAAHGTRLPEGIREVIQNLHTAAEEELYRALRDKTDEAESRRNALRAYFYRIGSFLDVLERFDNHYEYFLFYENDELRLKLFCIDPSAVIRERTDLGRASVLFSATLSPISYYRSLLGLSRDGECLSVPSPFDQSQMCIAIMDKISTRTSERDRTLPEVLRAIAATVSAKRGHYIVFTPSFEYTERIAEAFRARYPKIRTMVQGRSMTQKEKEDFMAAFAQDESTYLVAFCVTGGIFSEGIDLWGDRLIGTVVVGVTLPSLSFEREAMQAYYAERYETGREFAYVYPGLNKVLQAAGRVIRREDDYGVIVLIDDRFSDPLYRKSIPTLWHGLKFVGEAKGLRMLLDRFWSATQEAKDRNQAISDSRRSEDEE